MQCGSAACATLAMVSWMIVAAFICDWSFNLSANSRYVLLAVEIACCVIILKKLGWRFRSKRESLEDIALIVERHHNIDNDLVAAIQFENSHATTWGSPELAGALIENVARLSPSLNVYRGFSYEALPKRAIILAATMLVVIGGMIAWPGHAAAFWNRVRLGTANYPTRTSIELIVVNGQPVTMASDAAVSQIYAPYGRSISVRVKCRGELPVSGSAQMTSLNGNLSNRIHLHAQQADRSTFAGDITHVADSFRVTVQLGDAVSIPVEVFVVPLPLVDIHWDVSPPDYASISMNPGDSNSDSYQFAVLEGSTARLNLICSNKQLTSARIKVGESSFELLPSNHSDHRSNWSLPAQTPFEKIREALTYEIQVTDPDGLSLQRPIVGQIRLKPDRPPKIVASAVTQQVLPTAQPKLDFTITDDFGVSKIVAAIHFSREDGQVQRHEILVRAISEAEQPLTIVHGQVAIPLSQFKLMKGDEVKAVLEATDWRGDILGQTGQSAPVAFNVTDINGILIQLNEADKKSAKLMEEILRHEIAVGKGSK